MTNEEMSQKTKQALADALKSAMKTKKLSKITVSELIAACNINRKTFYYHFQDIYALLKWMLEQEALEVIKNFDLIIDTEEAIRFVMDYAEKNNYIISGAFDSMGYEEIKRFFHADLFSVIYGTLEQGEEKLNVRLEPQFKQFLAEFYTEASAGLLIEWTKNRFTQDKETVLQNIVSIFKITMPVVLKEKNCTS
ncbi:MAG: TetR family transcriptional regulator [Clostridiales bacterium]|nr:MAG: TetR family transcriptional regulator [Clostridiales bacterium]